MSNSMFAPGPESCQSMLYNARDLQHDGFTWYCSNVFKVWWEM